MITKSGLLKLCTNLFDIFWSEALPLNCLMLGMTWAGWWLPFLFLQLHSFQPLYIGQWAIQTTWSKYVKKSVKMFCLPFEKNIYSKRKEFVPLLDTFQKKLSLKWSKSDKLSSLAEKSSKCIRMQTAKEMSGFIRTVRLQMYIYKCTGNPLYNNMVHYTCRAAFSHT